MDLTEDQQACEDHRERWQKQEYIRCQIDPIYFLDTYGWIKDPATSQVLRFKLWEHQKWLIRLWEEYLESIGVKAKQDGISWTAAGYGLHKAKFNPATSVIMMSRGEREAAELLGKARFIEQHLPPWLQNRLGLDQMQQMSFPVMDSELLSLPATKEAGVGKTGSLVIQDEWDFHPFPEENYANLKATVGDGAQFIGFSTVDKMRTDSFFRKMFIQARAGLNNFHPYFLPWSVRPDRDMDWYNKQLKDYSAEPWMVEQNYPNTEEEALSPPQALAAFNQQALKDMENWCRGSICSVAEADLAHIYQKYVVGRRYAAFTDTSHGVGKDYGVTVVMDLQNGLIMADIMSNLLPPEELARQSVELLKEYHNPLWAIEDNDWGKATLDTAENLGYRNLYYRDGDKREKVGWTTGKSNVWTLWTELIEAIASRLITIPNKEGLGQFFQVIRNPDKHGKIEAQEGANDDYPFAVGGCWQMRKEVKGTGTGRAVSLLHPATSSY